MVVDAEGSREFQLLPNSTLLFPGECNNDKYITHTEIFRTFLIVDVQFKLSGFCHYRECELMCMSLLYVCTPLSILYQQTGNKRNACVTSCVFTVIIVACFFSGNIYT